uniref:Reverse transcriptase n=1 Tax=Tanacetum cinerariifolium TaxID=118510 RepID=A0A6L2LMC1_TANCI|nr:reverse transcriptase [Tanacetum cinerariifolium]
MNLTILIDESRAGRNEDQCGKKVPKLVPTRVGRGGISRPSGRVTIGEGAKDKQTGQGVRAVLMQEGRSMAYFSQVLGLRAQLKSVYVRELMAIIDGFLNYQSMIEIQYRLGRENEAADALSRRGEADGKRKDVEFAVGDLVYLKLRPYRHILAVKRVDSKLSPRYYGSFVVVERIRQDMRESEVTWEGFEEVWRQFPNFHLEDKDFMWSLQGTEFRTHAMLLPLEGPATTTNIPRSYREAFDQLLTIKVSTSLPPQREHDNRIVLQEGIPPVNIRPYKHPPTQKDAIQLVVKE